MKICGICLREFMKINSGIFGKFTKMAETVIYDGITGKMEKINEPKSPDGTNFIIQYKGLDWSGFRTLKECEEQFAHLEEKPNTHYFTVVERY